MTRKRSHKITLLGNQLEKARLPLLDSQQLHSGSTLIFKNQKPMQLHACVFFFFFKANMGGTGLEPATSSV
jgi:hypothetical protein